MTDKFEDYLSKLKSRWGEDPAGSLCIELVTYLNRQSEDQLRMLTYSSIAKILNRNALDEDIQKVVTILVSSSLYALEQKHIFIDAELQEEIDPHQFKNICATNKFVHPRTGELVPDWRTKVFPYFTPSTRFLELRGR